MRMSFKTRGWFTFRRQTATTHLLSRKEQMTYSLDSPGNLLGWCHGKLAVSDQNDRILAPVLVIDSPLVLQIHLPLTIDHVLVLIGAGSK